MDKNQMKILGIACLVICAICLFVAVERYQANANKVKAINSSPLGGAMRGMTGQSQLKAATPAATKYALFFALISGIGGGVLLAKSRQDGDVGQIDSSDS